MKQMLAIAGLAVLLASCNTNYEKTPSGLAYKIFKGEGKQKLKFGDIVKISATIKISPRDTVLFTTTGSLPEYIPVDTSSRQTHDFNEVLKLCSVGDSLVVVSQIDTLVKRNMAQYNEMFKRGDQIITGIRILQSFPGRDQVVADQQKEIDKKKNSEVADLEKYLKDKGIKAQKTENGVFVEVKNAGQGEKAAEGKQVTVDYTGYLLSNGKPFDSNQDSTIGRIAPFSFVIGRDPVIQGWSEGLKAFGSGGKGTLYIPSLMAYGPQGQPPVIPRFAALKFDVNVKNVTTAPPAQARPGMPSMQDMQGMGQDPNQQQDPRQQQSAQPQGH